MSARSALFSRVFIYISITYFLFFQWPEKKLAKRLEWMCKRKNPKEEELKELKDQLMFKHVDSLRKDQLRRLKEWQDEVNQLDQKAIKITVENEHDLEG